jgi:hypothetical protein
MELEIRKYLAFITLLIASFLLVNHYSTRIQPRQDLYWPVSVQSLSVTPPKTFISHKDGYTTITWTGYSHPVDIQKSLSLESGEWTTISESNSSGKFVDVDAKESMAFYRLNYVTKL